MKNTVQTFAKAGKDIIVLSQAEKSMDPSTWDGYSPIGFTCHIKHTDVVVAFVKTDKFTVGQELSAQAWTGDKVPYLTTDDVTDSAKSSCLQDPNGGERVMGSIPLTDVNSGDGFCLIVGSCRLQEYNPSLPLNARTKPPAMG